VFTSERGAPFTNAGFARMLERAGRLTKLPFKSHPHMQAGQYLSRNALNRTRVRRIARDLETGVGTVLRVSRTNWQRESGPRKTDFAQLLLR
jgi:hypothetical protein